MLSHGDFIKISLIYVAFPRPVGHGPSHPGADMPLSSVGHEARASVDYGAAHRAGS
jgi:hypothetical protein